MAEELYDAAVRTYWDAKAPAQYRALRVEARSRLPKELSLPRRELGHLLAVRSGHGDFANYHRRFNHTDALLDCSCSSEKERLHFFYCRRMRRHRHRPHRQSGTTLASWDRPGGSAFAKWCQETQF